MTRPDIVEVYKLMSHRKRVSNGWCDLNICSKRKTAAGHQIILGGKSS